MASPETIPEACVKVRSPWGDFHLYGTVRGLTRLEFPGDAAKTRAVKEGLPPGENLKRGARSLERYFQGGRRDFSGLKYDLRAKPPFDRKVLQRLARLRTRDCLTYGELSRLAGSPSAARAVGGAMRRNDLPVLIPCHRVFAAGGRIGGYSKGLVWKKRLLSLEGFQSKAGV